MKLLKTLGILMLIVISGFLIVPKSVTTVYECLGELTDDDRHRERASMFMKHTRYRWWVHLWSDSDGNVKTEFVHGMHSYYNTVEDYGDGIRFGWEGGDSGRTLLNAQHEHRT